MGRAKMGNGVRASPEGSGLCPQGDHSKGSWPCARDPSGARSEDPCEDTACWAGEAWVSPHPPTSLGMRGAPG